MKYGDHIRVKTYLGDIREGIVREVLQDNSLMVEIDEQVLPDIKKDLYCKDSKGRFFTVYKSRFPKWEAWITPGNVLGYVQKDDRA